MSEWAVSQESPQNDGMLIHLIEISAMIETSETSFRVAAGVGVHHTRLVYILSYPGNVHFLFPRWPRVVFKGAAACLHAS